MVDPARTPANALFSKLRQNFAVGASAVPKSPTPTPSTPVPAPIPTPAPISSDLVDKLYAKLPAKPVVNKPVAPVGAIHESPPPTDEFSSDFLNNLLPAEPPAPPTPPISSLAAAVPTAVAQAAAASLNPAQPTSSTVKETPVGAIHESPSTSNTVEVPIQYVESEPSIEMSPEVESFLTEVKSHQDQMPQEVVVAQQPTNTILQPIAQPVVILPITPEIEQKGQRKNPSFSIRWLVEWSRKMIKIFTGRVVYKI